MTAPVLTDELRHYLITQGYAFIREIPGHGICGVANQLYTTGLFVGLEMDYRAGRYCYTHPIYAIKAILSWDGTGDPPGDWIKYYGVGGERHRIEEEYG